MLSHLRFHRRGPSSPASPLPDQNPTSPHSSALSPFSVEPFSPDQPAPSSTSPALPPTLPPITLVTSAEADPSLESRRDADMAPESDPRPQQQSRSPYNGGSGFIGGVALQKYHRDMQTYSVDPVDNSRSPIPPSGPSRPLSQTARNSTMQPASFSTPTDLQNSAGAPTGRRPAGARVQTDLPMLSPIPSNAENPKPKKGLPFLKNPMSTLLMRRKTSQQMASLSSLPLRGGPEEPMYDPRIKGTRVHDFSAPRPRKVTPAKDPIHVPSPSGSSILPDQANISSPSTLSPEHAQTSTASQRVPSNASGSIYSHDSGALKNTPSTISAISDPLTGSPDASVPPPPQHAPPPPPPAAAAPNNEPISVQPRSSQASRLIDETGSVYSRTSTRLAPSRGPSVSGFSIKDASALPRHMKSTSSRFSFDMIGAAKQEKLLEERHRQREAEKRISEPPPAHRDSRFDDFDEDGFDYDAMMDDDGLEERIPGVNADYEDEYYEEEINMVGDDDVVGDINGDELDPDNDQENFAGFVFQRSNPTSSLTSPQSAGFLMTPRDTDGNPIGYAMSRYSPGLPDSISPGLLSPHLPPSTDQAAGLGIQGLDVPGPTQLQNQAAFQHNQQLEPANPPKPSRQDDLYFDGGMTGFENEFAEDLAAPPEWDDTPFDESIFDNNDTDQFGRPIAGAFAQAQAERRAALQESTKRESDITSRLSALSGISQSTAHTSLSVSGAEAVPDEGVAEVSPPRSPEENPAPSKGIDPDEDSVAAYQAALAAAAHKAVLSGKLNCGSSPPLAEPPTSAVGYSLNIPDRGDSFDDDDDYGYEDMADFELDDDAIIAEANASALANDSDGWYGQEFGFYSAPAHQGSQSTTEFEYANGGVFAPKGGLDRSISGRMVSREPNLTPITERSEYSNRNSIMSLNMPGFTSGTPIQSPGLAQLALLGDRGDEMSLSALLRLRSKAWGGSQASLVSSQGSPRSERGDVPGSPWAPTFSSPTTYQARKNSVLSTVSQDSDDNYSVSGSPTLTAGIPGLTCSPPPVPPLGEHRDASSEGTGALSSPIIQNHQQWDALYSPITSIPDTPLSPSGVNTLERHKSSSSAGSNGTRRTGLGHRHKGSAESISYMKEEDSGATRWVLERRRTGESGQEILEREVVENGHI